MTEKLQKNELLRVTADIVGAYVQGHQLDSAALQQLVRDTYATLVDVARTSLSDVAVLSPAVSVENSVQPDYLVCLEDGKQLKMLKRYLKAVYGMTPREYREKWGLGEDYPMVAPNYAKKRRQLAKAIGLGKSRPFQKLQSSQQGS